MPTPNNTTSTGPNDATEASEDQSQTPTPGTEGTPEGQEKSTDQPDPAENAGTEGKDGGDGEANDNQDEALPDRVKEVMRKEREAAKQSRREAADAKRLLDRYKAQHGELPDEPADPAAEAIAKANQRIVKSEVKAAAKGRFQNPADAFAFIDLSEFEVNDDGEVDADEIEAALDKVLEDRPYLGAEAQTTKPPKFEGTADQGAGHQAAARQWTAADFAGKSPAQIEEARKSGLLTNLLKGD